MSSIRCIRCGGTTKKARSSDVFFSKIVVDPISVLKCTNCGEEYTEGSEYERVRLKVKKVRKDAKPVLAQIRMMVI